jgi:hypothetical protein
MYNNEKDDAFRRWRACGFSFYFLYTYIPLLIGHYPLDGAMGTQCIEQVQNNFSQCIVHGRSVRWLVIDLHIQVRVGP